MAITLSHQTALDVIRSLRADQTNIQEMDTTPLSQPTPWLGKRWSMREFDTSEWKWRCPSAQRPLDILVPQRTTHIQTACLKARTSWAALPSRSVLWLDQYSSMVCPELLFLQMAETLAFPHLVMLGYELCGHFSRCAEDPLNGTATLNIPAATDVASIDAYLSSLKGARHRREAKEALRYVCDNAVSPMEAVLATLYSLPTTESGYGMGPVTLNPKVSIDDPDNWSEARSRYPDIMFSFAPIGINYDGADEHLDLEGLVKASREAALAEVRENKEAGDDARAALESKLHKVRRKAVDDRIRDRQLAAQGRLVFPVMKEDLYGSGHLDSLTRQILDAAHNIFGIDTLKLKEMLTDTDRKRDREALIASLLPSGSTFGSSHGKI